MHLACISLHTTQIDEANALKTTDHRLLRRMSRDYLFRGHSASRTLSMWSNVRRGEGRWIFPHQDAVDFVVNSAMEYEMAVWKPSYFVPYDSCSHLMGDEEMAVLKPLVPFVPHHSSCCLLRSTPNLPVHAGTEAPRRAVTLLCATRRFHVWQGAGIARSP